MYIYVPCGHITGHKRNTSGRERLGTSGTLVGGRDLAATPKSISLDFSTSQLGSIMMEWAKIHNVNS